RKPCPATSAAAAPISASGRPSTGPPPRCGMPEVSRRQFIQTGLAIGGGLLLGFHLPVARAEAAAAEFSPNAFVHVGADNSVKILIGRSEMGQGVFTSLPMIVAEELEVDFSKVKVEHGPADKAFVNPRLGSQATGGS